MRDLLAESCLRLLAGAVPKRTLADLRGSILRSPNAFPWREVNEEIAALPVDEDQLLQSGIRGQRDWILRGGAARPRKSVRHHGKTILAYVLSRLIFFVLYTLAAVVLLVLLKHRWPGLDIYRLLEWL